MAIYDLPFFSFPALPLLMDRSNVKVAAAKLDAGMRVSRGPELVYDRVHDLRPGGKTSERFSKELTALAERVMTEVELRASVALLGYSRYVTSRLREAPLSRGESAVQLLTLGMALRLYRDAAAATPGWIVDLARELFWTRQRSPGFKPILDFFRVALIQVFMARKLRPAGTSPAARDGVLSDYRLSDLPALIEWLQATGEFEPESIRLDNWNCYLRTLPAEKAEEWIRAAISLFDWFQSEAQRALGAYTAGVDRFLQTQAASRFWRGDHFFSSRRPVENHLGMIAAEIMKHTVREAVTRKPIKLSWCLHACEKSIPEPAVHGSIGSR